MPELKTKPDTFNTRLGIQNGNVVVYFEAKISWFALEVSSAREFAAAILEAANMLDDRKGLN